MDPKSNDWCPHKKIKVQKMTHREDNLKKGTEIGAMLPQAKECLGWPETRTGKDSSLEPWEGAWNG